MNMEKPHFYAFYKDPNTGKVTSVDVLDYVFRSILTKEGKFDRKKFTVFDRSWKRVPVKSKDELKRLVELELRDMFWCRCEWEVVVCDWPYRDDGLIKSARPYKIDVYDQIEPNLPVIVDLVWNYVMSLENAE